MGELLDLVVVGGGLAGASLARPLAEQGARVLVLERDEQFRDRVRGEMMISETSVKVSPASRRSCRLSVGRPFSTMRGRSYSVFATIPRNWLMLGFVAMAIPP